MLRKKVLKIIFHDYKYDPNFFSEIKANKQATHLMLSWNYRLWTFARSELCISVLANAFIIFKGKSLKLGLKGKKRLGKMK